MLSTVVIFDCVWETCCRDLLPSSNLTKESFLCISLFLLSLMEYAWFYEHHHTPIGTTFGMISTYPYVGIVYYQQLTIYFLQSYYFPTEASCIQFTGQKIHVYSKESPSYNQSKIFCYFGPAFVGCVWPVTLMHMKMY